MSPSLQICTIADSYQPLGISSIAQSDPTSFIHSDVNTSTALMKKDGDIPSGKADLTILRKPMSAIISVSERRMVPAASHKWKVHCCLGSDKLPLKMFCQTRLDNESVHRRIHQSSHLHVASVEQCSQPAGKGSDYP